MFLTENSFDPDYNREKLATMIFELFEANSLQIASSATLIPFSAGITTGVVFESGDEITQSCALLDGVMQPQTQLKRAWGGRSLT